jgi:hypothetical protein
MNCKLRSRLGVLLALLAAVHLNGQRISSNGELMPYIPDRAGAERAESDLAAHPENVDLAGQLLDYYLQHWQQPEVDGARLRLILWTIANHPDIRLAARHDPRALVINPDDSNDYAQVRKAWIDQVARHLVNAHAGDAQVLANAAQCLGLADRELAADWIKQAMRLDPRNFSLVSELGDIYAGAISGESGMNPWEGPTSVDAAETQSDFAKLAMQEAGRESELAARTGWALHLISEALGEAKIEAPDYDSVAEKLLVQAANLDYPKPSGVPLLSALYRDQKRKASGRLVPQWRTVELAPEEQAARLVEKSERVSLTDRNFHAAVTVQVKITIGIDGHVWKAEALGAPQIAGPVAAGSTNDWTYQPLRIDGEPVQVSTVVQVTVEPLLTSHLP